MPLSIDTRMTRLAQLADVAYHREEGDEYWYRPRQMLVHWRDYDQVRRRFPDEFREAEEEDLRERPEGQPLPLVRCLMPEGVDIPTLVRRARAVEQGPEPRVSPHHIFGVAPETAYGPGDIALASDERLRGLPDLAECDERYTVGVLDSGVQLDHNPRQAEHAALCLQPGADEEAIDDLHPDGMLDDADAHGIFVADVVRRHAPKARVAVRKALLGMIGDEVTIADGIAILAARLDGRMPVLNLSLYGYTSDNIAPLAIVEALRALRPRPVVVAAAGNISSFRPAWPAALKNVLGVAAVDDRQGADPVPADFTNRGPWVDACASGVGVLGPFVAFEEQDHLGHVSTPLGPGNPGPQAFQGQARWSGTSFAAPKVAGRIVQRAMELGGDPYEAARTAARELLDIGTEVPDLGVYVP